MHELQQKVFDGKALMVCRLSPVITKQLIDCASDAEDIEQYQQDILLEALKNL